MALNTTTILNMPIAVGVDSSAWLPIVQDASGVPTSFRCTAQQVANLFTGTFVPTTRQVNSGVAMNGGGALTTDITLNVDLTKGDAYTLITPLTPVVGALDPINDYLLVQVGTQLQKVNTSSLSLTTGNMPAGGTTGQALLKASNADYDTVWASSNFLDQLANTVYAGPTSGPDAQPAFRALVGADLPNPGASSKGGVQSYAAVSNQFLTQISTSGVVSSAQPTIAGIAGLGTGVATALAVNVGSAGAFVTFNGALGTPSSGTATNLTGLPLTTGVTGVLPAANGGTGVNNGSSTITLGGALTTTGAFTANFTMTGNTSVTFPTSGTLATTGGSNIPSVAQGDLLYGSATNVLSALVKDTNATRYLANTGTSNNPAWAQVNLANGVTGTLPAGNGGTGITALGTGVATALGINVGSAGAFVTFNGALGTPASGTLTNCTGLPLSTGVTGQLALANGGTNANLTASNGGIFYSTASAGAILSGTATAGQIIRSGASAAPSWSTSVYPATSAAGTILASLTSNTITASAAPVLGASGSATGQLGLSGATSGTITIKPSDAAGTYNFNLPTTVGSAGQVLTSQGGGSTAMTWETVAGTGTVTSVAASFTGGLIAVGGSPVTTAGTLAFTVAGTSGGVPYFSGASTWGSSAALAASAIVLGGGAGNPPATTTTGTGVVTALGVNTGSAGAFVVNGGALGTPASGTLTNCTGLPVAGGGTGLATLTSNVIYKGNGTSAMATSSITDNGTTVTTTLPVVSPIFAAGYTTTATAAGTTTLTVASTRFQFFTGTTTQTVVLPVTSTLTTGLTYTIVNNSTGVVTVQSSGANNVLVMGAGSTADIVCILTSGTTAASWSVQTTYANIPQNSQSAAYTTVISDAGKHILHPTADNNARTFTIDSNANVPYPVGTSITFVNQINTVTISITSDTLTLAGAGSTGSRTLAANGIATALKIASTSWIISGVGLS